MWQDDKEDEGPAAVDARCPVCAGTGQSLDLRTVGDSFAKTQITATPDVPTPAHLFGPAISGYEIVGVLGQGGMGVVYKAQQLGLKRLVGLKMMLNAASDPVALGRFRAEAEAVAQLQHPNIVQIYEIGECQGRPFFAMELVEGFSLSRALTRNLFPLRDTAQLIATLARAIHVAHQRGIIHRDLKPGNILLQLAGAASLLDDDAPGNLHLQNAVPKITDFGAAKRLDTQGPTITGAILGTPSYMPPEQAIGDLASIGPTTDIYALGAILYEMLTGQPPFRGHSPTETLWQVVHDDPVPPGLLRSQLPPDLATICLTCLQKDPRQRYTNAEKLADDLDAYLAGLPIQARAATKAQRAMAWLRTHPATALFGSVGGLALLGLAVGLWLQSALWAGALAVLSLCVGAWWYSVRLQRALVEVRQQNLFSQRSVERMHLLLETVHRLLSAPSLDQRLRILGEATARLVNAERATIFLIDEARGELWSKLALGEERSEIRIPMGKGIAGSVAATGKLINLPDPYNDPRFNPEVDRRTGFTTRNLLTLPMDDPTGKPLGVLQVLNKRGGAFGPEDIEILEHLAQSASLIVNDKTRP